MPAITVSPAALRVVTLLVGNPPRTIQELTEATGVTRTAITEQLNELVGAKLVERGLEKLPGRGRPRHRYSATNAALQFLWAHNPHRVVPAIWRAIEAAGGSDLMKKVVKRVSRELAEHYSSRITAKTPRERLERFIELFRDEGGLVDVVHQNGRMMVHKRSCPFISMVDEHRTVCIVDMEMMSAVVGRPVRRTACRLEGAPCCVLELRG